MGHVEDGTVTFGIPKGEIKEAYFDLILKQMYNLGVQMSQTQYSGSSVPLMIRLLISHIPSESHRNELRTKIDNNIKEKIQGIKDTETKNKLTVEAYVDSVGEISDYLEKFMGIEKENRIGFTRKVHEDKFIVFNKDDKND